MALTSSRGSICTVLNVSIYNDLRIGRQRLFFNPHVATMARDSPRFLTVVFIYAAAAIFGTGPDVASPSPTATSRCPFGRDPTND